VPNPKVDNLNRESKMLKRFGGFVKNHWYQDRCATLSMEVAWVIAIVSLIHAWFVVVYNYCPF